jgi:membrane carboxypeptidase/penicillin-binding protein PbpC
MILIIMGIIDMTDKMQNVIQLDDSLLLGTGSERHCFRHPHDSSLCIKLQHRIKFKGTRQRICQNENEFRFYTYLQKRIKSWVHIPRCYGWVDTNKGKGLVFDLIQNSNGEVLPTLEKQIDSGLISKEEALQQVKYLQEYLISNGILLRTLYLGNLIYNPEIEGKFKLTVIDDIGSKNSLSFIIQRSKLLTKMKLARHFRGFYSRFNERYNLV